jgi:hypothetical protein
MAMSSKATITAKTGPGLTASATSIKNVTGYTVDLVRKIMFVTTSDHPSRQVEYDINGVTTFTTTIAGADYTITLS